MEYDFISTETSGDKASIYIPTFIEDDGGYGRIYIPVI